MNFVGNLTLGQLTKLFIMFKLSIIQIFDILKLWGCIHFEFQTLKLFGTAAARHGASHQAVTALTAVSLSTPVIAGHRHPCG
jgi:hypothetical protein